jgi:very-short-patch-repair endonuclease
VLVRRAQHRLPTSGEVGARSAPGGESQGSKVGRSTRLTSGLVHGAAVADPGRVHSPEVDNARWLRNNMTQTERRVWSRLRGRQLGGYKFRRQVPVGPYVVDFICVSDRLAVEVDGPLHEDEDSDERKTTYLQAKGYRVLRIPVSDVDESMDDVIHGIYLELAHPTRQG